ncbi:MAG TPA: MnhB domain-containing protein [bacterium]|nr:MnhB domain-containing protein [bacterium]
MEFLLAVLLVFMLVGALIAIETRDLLSSVICTGAVGYLASVAFLFLGAPDIAITQVVVEILVLILLIRATISRDVTAPAGDREFFGLVVSLAFMLVTGVAGMRILGDAFPKFGTGIFAVSPLAPASTYLARGWQLTGATNIVAAVTHDFRGLDTLFEATILFATVLGALTVLRARGHRERAEEAADDEPLHEGPEFRTASRGMTMLVQRVARGMAGFIFLYGVYIVLYGHLRPGGGFAGGIMIACTFILLLLALGKDGVERYLTRRFVGRFSSIGAVMLLLLGWLGFARGGWFLGNFLHHAGGLPAEGLLAAGTMPLANLAIALNVVVSLVLLFASLAVLRVVVRQNRRRMVKRG